MFFLKWLLVLGLLAAGAFFLLTGLGIEIPVVKYQGWEGQRVPAGAVLLAAGIPLAYFWKIQVTTSTKETSFGPGGLPKWTKETKRTKKGIK